ncbi:MAG: zinc ribbon domain-containing protein [Candidatus Woesearchaeota archaeon]|jgi:RNA polymerase subunit RPABC4/transcription elongation factor Spt4|nr:zinc ribbon domain-containing protein [Candidatus Woesearchaeota archaeon]|tara:strand:- start:993 stop:1109 length:117 start_codon:yes stop_codon:yes gene_type:complete
MEYDDQRECPSCGTILEEGEPECPSCGENFVDNDDEVH